MGKIDFSFPLLDMNSLKNSATMSYRPSELSSVGFIKSLTGTHTIMVTPVLARYWLSLNTSNRSVRKTHVNYLKSVMDDGEWVLNGQPIVFSSDGKLLDGQHRLKAVIKHGDSVAFDVRFGIDPETFFTLDEGVKRNPSDVFNVKGVTNYTHKSAATKMIMDLLAGQKRGGGSNHKRISNKEIYDFFTRTPKINEVYPFCRGLYHGGGKMAFALSEIVAWYYLFSLKDEQAAIAFMEGVCVGTGLKEAGDVRILLRNKLVVSKLDKTQRMQTFFKDALVITAWNKFREGSQVAQLRVNPSKPLPEIK